VERVPREWGCFILQAIASELKTSVKPGCGAIKKFYHVKNEIN